MKLRPSKSDGEIPIALPARSDAVTIVWPSGKRTQAFVAARDSDGLLIAPVLAVGQSLETERVDLLALEFTSRQGRIRLQGTVTLEESEAFHFRDLHAVAVVQEREYVRVPVSGPATVSARSGIRSVHTFYVDLSGGGMRL